MGRYARLDDKGWERDFPRALTFQGDLDQLFNHEKLNKFDKQKQKVINYNFCVFGIYIL